MKLLSQVSLFGLTIVTASVVSAGSVLALTVNQTQELNTSTSTSTTLNCVAGQNCSATAETSSSSSGKQTQHVDVLEAAQIAQYRYRSGRVIWIPSTTVMMINDGQVRLSWPIRGGTCQVRYSEANHSGWKYATSTGCDDSGVTIGGLQPGWRYKFQVQQDNGPWSRVMTGRAH